MGLLFSKMGQILKTILPVTLKYTWKGFPLVSISMVILNMVAKARWLLGVREWV